MRTLVVTGGWILGIAGAAAFGQPAELSLVLPDGSTTISAGQRITVEVFVDQVFAPTLLRTYQAQLEIVPAPGSTGSLVLADPRLPPDPNDAIFIDIDRSDWVFAGEPGVFPTWNVEKLRIAATLLSGGVEPGSPRQALRFVANSDPIDTRSYNICGIVCCFSVAKGLDLR